MAFELTPAAAVSLGFTLDAEPAPTPSTVPMGSFIQFRLNGVDLGDDQIDVIDFIVPD